MPPKGSPKKKLKKDKKPRVKKIKKEPRFTQEELDEEFDFALTTRNPYISENVVEYEIKTQSYKPLFDFRKAVVYFKTNGALKPILMGATAIIFGEDEEAKVPEKEERMRNKFNFRSVSSQTPYRHPAERSTQIDAASFPVLIFGTTASKAEILDAYKEKESGEKKIDLYGWTRSAAKKIVKMVGRTSLSLGETNRRYLRLCERMVDQNMSEANLDFTYYDNPNDEFRSDIGSLLPLWSIGFKLVRSMPVTGLCWNTHYQDLFAVGYRAPSVEKAEDDLGLVLEEGYVCVYSLKGPSHPERIYLCPSAVFCLDFHPNRPYLFTVGFLGGSVAVCDLRREVDSPSGLNLKSENILHQDRVYHVQWLRDAMPQKFCSVSMDGKIINWKFLLHDVFPCEVVTSLQIKDSHFEVPPKGIETGRTSAMEEVGLKMGGTSLSVMGDSFTVGTCAGDIHVGSLEERVCTSTYTDHKHFVRSVHWNSFNPDVFLSCGKDFTVRIWHRSIKSAIFEFFFEFEVIDACFAPFSSTLIAVTSGNAVVYVFDLASNKTEAIGTYTVYTPKQNARLTKVRFHPRKPVLLVGDDRGRVSVFKLSPNLRSSLKVIETMERDKYVASEVEKMEKLIAPAKGYTK